MLDDVRQELSDMKAACESGKCKDLIDLREKLEDTIHRLAVRDNQFDNEVQTSKEALACVAVMREKWKQILGTHTYERDPKDCWWCHCTKAGFHYPDCPRTIAHEILNTPAAKLALDWEKRVRAEAWRKVAKKVEEICAEIGGDPKACLGILGEQFSVAGNVEVER